MLLKKMTLEILVHFQKMNESWINEVINIERRFHLYSFNVKEAHISQFKKLTYFALAVNSITHNLVCIMSYPMLFVSTGKKELNSKDIQ